MIVFATPFCSTIHLKKTTIYQQTYHATASSDLFNLHVNHLIGQSDTMTVRWNMTLLYTVFRPCFVSRYTDNYCPTLKRIKQFKQCLLQKNKTFICCHKNIGICNYSKFVISKNKCIKNDCVFI